MIKMIVMDLDNTLLRTDRTISDYSKLVLDQCRKLGIKIVYATARGRSAENVAPSEYFDGRIIENGSIAYIGNKIVYNRLVPFEKIQEFLFKCEQNGFKTSFEKIKTYCLVFEIVYLSQNNEDINKQYIHLNNVNEILFLKSHLPDELYLIPGRENLGMITHKDASKSKSIEVLIQIWSIHKTEIMAFGDDLNDLDMLKYAGISVAMGNAVEEVKAIADFTCLNNDEDGVAKWIIKMGIIK